MNTHPRWVRIHNRRERLPRASKHICPKMRPHFVRRRQHLPKIFPLSRKFARIVSDIFVSQAIIRRRQFGDSKTWHKSKLDIIFVDKNTNSTKLPTRLIRPISPHIKVFSSIVDIFLLPILVLLSGDRCRDGSCLPRPQRYYQTRNITGQGKVVYTCSAAASQNRPAAHFSQLDLFRALGGGTWRHRGA